MKIFPVEWHLMIDVLFVTSFLYFISFCKASFIKSLKTAKDLDEATLETKLSIGLIKSDDVIPETQDSEPEKTGSLVVHLRFH